MKTKWWNEVSTWLHVQGGGVLWHQNTETCNEAKQMPWQRWWLCWKIAKGMCYEFFSLLLVNIFKQFYGVYIFNFGHTTYTGIVILTWLPFSLPTHRSSSISHNLKWLISNVHIILFKCIQSKHIFKFIKIPVYSFCMFPLLM